MYSWNTTIDDSSSMLAYTPFADGASLSGGWMPWYSGYPGNFIRKPGDDSTGQSLHYTAMPGASVYLQFQGTALYLYGEANCSYTVTLDDVQSSPLNASPDGLLFSQDGLNNGTHSFNLTAQPLAGSNQQLAFDQAIITNVLDEDVNGLIAVQIDNQNQTALQYSGSWSTEKDAQIPSKTDPAPYMQTNDFLASVSTSFTGAVAVAINGSRDWGHWTYDISLDGVKSSYNSSTYWLIGDALLFYQGNLDPNATHQIELVNTGDGTYFAMSLNYITLWKPNATDLIAEPPATLSSSLIPIQGPSTVANPQTTEGSTQTSRKVNVGVIVGPIIAALVVLVAALILFLRWRRRGQQTSPEEPKDVNVTPFPLDPPPTTVQPMTYTVQVSSKRAQNRVSPPPPPSTQTGASAATSTPPPSQDPPSSVPLDVNQIIELIARRIDPAVGRSAGSDDSSPPPRYPASAM